jgi:4-hydroxythreonine-4-phosphate dehydrogenase
LHVESSSVPPEEIRPGNLSRVAGEAAARAILAAVRLARTKRVAAIVTAPVSKQALHLSGIQYPGQTEMLQDLSGSRHVAMMLVSKTMKIGLVTIHLPLAAVARALTHELLTDRLTVIRDAMRRDWGIPHPLLAVLGLNPHAGEGGDIGTEEQRVIIPVIEKLRKAGFRLEGPYPADGFFGRQDYTRYDAVVAMYHDQGLIPVKMTARNAAVNVSAGLTIVRTSPDHGTAFGLAGRNAADPASMREAITLAVTIAQRRSVRR